MSRPQGLAQALALVGSLFAAAACGRDGPARGVVLVTLDTTRADHLGCYGDARAKTPVIDALAAEGARFAQAGTAVTTTLASHATMFTGLYPPAHGVRYNGVFRLAGAAPTVAERLREAGWATAAFPASFPVTAKTGLSRGFDVYRDLFEEPGGRELPMSAERKAEDVVGLARAWLAERGEGRFFAWVHLFDPHWPYEPPFPFSAEFRDRPYDGEIAYVDRQLGALFAALEERGLWDDVLVIVAGDHGEGLYDHGERQHGNLAYESTLHVPLIVKPPGRARARVVEEPVTLADVAPTILDYAGAALPAGLHGVSLREAVRSGRAPRRDLYFESLAGSLNYGWSALEGWRRGNWKLIRSSSPELYDLASDPGEITNAIGREGGLADDLEAALSSHLSAWTSQAPSEAETAASLDREALARLASLGYQGGTISRSHRGGASPVSKIHLEVELLNLRDLVGARAWGDALPVARTILKDDPANLFALYNGALAAAKLPDRATGRALARECTRLYPEFRDGVVLAAQIEIAAGDHAATARILRAALARTPGDPALTYPLAASLIASGRVDEARGLVDAGLAAKDPDASFHVLRALLRARAGDGTGAMTSLRDAFAHGYRDLETLRTEPVLAPLRAVPGFDDTLAAMARE